MKNLVIETPHYKDAFFTSHVLLLWMPKLQLTTEDINAKMLDLSLLLLPNNLFIHRRRGISH